MKKRLSKFRGLKILIFLFVVIALPAGFYLYNRLSQSSVEFDAVALADKVMVGESYDVKVGVKNGSKSPLKNVDLVFHIPDGVILATGEKSRISHVAIGEIGPGGQHEEIVKFIALPVAVSNNAQSVDAPAIATPSSEAADSSSSTGAGKSKAESDKTVYMASTDQSPSSRDIQASVSYSIGNITASFEQKKSVKIMVESIPYSLEISTPNKILAGQVFEVASKYKYSGDAESPDTKLEIDYPKVFTKTKATPKSDFADNSWIIPKLAKDQDGQVSLKGSVDLPDDSALSMTVKILMKILDRDYPILSKDISIPVAPSPLSLKVYLNDNKQTVYKPGDALSYTLIYQNNTDVSLNNISVSAKLVGQMYDYSSIKFNNANYSDLSKTMTWDFTTLPGLQTLAAGSSGSLNFSVNLLQNYPIKRLNDKNFTVKVAARIESPTVPRLVSASKTTNETELQTKIAGNIGVEAKALYRDADSLILNMGALPPKVDQPTAFTIHWLLTNYSNDAKSIEVRAKVEDGVVFTGVIKGNTTQLPTIDEEAGEIVWKIDKLFATMGITGDKPEAIFQVMATPTSNYVGNYMPLVAQTTIKATDDFTSLDLASSALALTTRLETDPSVKEGDGKVVP